ncbi:MAG: FecR domain-containing protein [Chloroflexi bacterium]|nr:FecR domain-containing protein [Chloroflexota bacterium]
MQSRSSERLAWIILIAAFVIFCFLAVAIPLSIRWYILYAAVPLPAQLNPIQGKPLVWEQGYEEARGVVDSRAIAEGTRIRTDDVDRAMVTVGQVVGSETVLATVQLYSNSELFLNQVREPRFGISPEPYRVTLQVLSGRVRIVAARSAVRPLDLTVHTPHCRAQLTDGSYSVEVSGGQTEIAVRYGEAQVVAAGELVIVPLGQRTLVPWGQAPASPMPAARNLIVNGNFTEPLAPSWQTDTYQHSPDVVAGTAEIVLSDGRRGISFSRRGEEGTHTETGISQVIDQDVRDYNFLSLRLDVRLMYQSLSGGGYMSSEFPLMVRLNYTDVYGKEQFWVHGFYIRDPEQNWPILDGEKIPSFIWYPYESGNLIQILQATRPAHINSIRIYASGWNYESMAAEVGLIAR